VRLRVVFPLCKSELLRWSLSLFFALVNQQAPIWGCPKLSGKLRKLRFYKWLNVICLQDFGGAVLKERVLWNGLWR
jgi:hypothetical protein